MTDSSDLAGLAAYHAPDAPALTLAECLAQAAFWIQKAAEIGTAAVETAPEIETAEYWRQRAEEAERMIKAGAVKGMGINEDQEII